MFPPAIDIIPTSLAVAYSIGKYTSKKVMSHYVTYSPTHKQFFCFWWPPSCVSSVVSMKIRSQLLPKALRSPPSSPQDGLNDQDHDGLRISPFRTWLVCCVLVWLRQVDVFLGYVRVIRATNKHVQFRSLEAGGHQIVHQSWLIVQFIEFRAFLPGLVVSKPFDAQQASGEPPLCLHIYVPGTGKGREPKPYACLLGFTPWTPLKPIHLAH